MAVYITLTVVTVLISFLIIPKSMMSPCVFSREKAAGRAGLFMVFLLLFGVSACRIAVGNDYWVYRQYILFIGQNRKVATEFGFNALVRLIQWITGNQECYLLVLGLFSFATVYFFVKALYDQSEWFAGSLFLLLTGGYYFLSLNSVRYYFALALAMYSMKWILKGDHLRFVLTVLAGACFHKSILVVLLLYPLAKIRWNKVTVFIGTALGLSLVFFKDFYRKIIFFFYPYYENSSFDTASVSYVNILKSAAVIAFSLIYYKQGIKDSRKNQFYLNLQIGALLLYALGSFIPEISRIGYYMNVSMVFLIPGILTGIKNKKQKVFFTVLTGVCFAAFFAVFLQGAYDVSIRILPYRNWIFD